MTPLRKLLRAMPSSLNDACRTMEEADGHFESLEAALREIEAKTSGDRPTVNPDNAFEHWGKLNATLVAIRDIARAALSTAAGNGEVGK